MKKKIVRLGKLKFSRSQIASLNNKNKIVGGGSEVFTACNFTVDPHITCTPVCHETKQVPPCKKDTADTGNTLTN
jgi:hypothetical protein